MRRGRLPAFCCRDPHVNGLERLSGRNAFSRNSADYSLARRGGRRPARGAGGVRGTKRRAGRQLSSITETQSLAPRRSLTPGRLRSSVDVSAPSESSRRQSRTTSKLGHRTFWALGDASYPLRETTDSDRSDTRSLVARESRVLCTCSNGRVAIRLEM